MNMAVPQPTDARVPCPVCRSPIHPIAGRCKHCKTDLSAQRAVRPAAGAALPPLVAKPRAATPLPVAAPAYAPPIAAPYAAPHDAPTIASGVVEQPLLTLDSQPILPPRPSVEPGGTASTRSTWKSWPVIVIALATIAIVVAVILMAFPPGAAADNGKRTLEPPPAPERMDTNPGAHSHPGNDQNAPSPLDPGDLNPPPHAQITPPAPPADPNVIPRHIPDPIPPADPDADPDFGGLGGRTNPLGGGLGSLGGLGGANALGMMTAMMKHGCDRLTSCGGDPTLRVACQMALRAAPQSPVPSCPSAQRCLDKIDQMDCTTQGGDSGAALSLMMQLSECVEAMSC
jgi:hypothetical protein